ncbi:MAG: hypothetical protein TR69_WS6001000207 [candidate division WS6 bacterium OLB20]|uniref:Uncharacterized protein n=1 Tax=candidate division WS6 bacterium OLB20 TaxID=1617426 RepID=A0A136M0B1_9BACT|nr:MAG: hypothetical protein TR69_WS6001000207 [candidate division WS6 bacterium OLB20]
MSTICSSSESGPATLSRAGGEYDPASVLGGDLLGAVSAYNADLRDDPYGDFNIDELANMYLKEFVSDSSDPELYLPVHYGGYQLARFMGGTGEENGVSAVDLNYYYPWVGQIPRMMERISIFLTNVDTPDSAAAFKDLQCGELQLIDTNVKKRGA